MNGTLLHVTRQHVACFVLCVLIKIPCLISTFRRQILFTRRDNNIPLHVPLELKWQAVLIVLRNIGLLSIGTVTR